MRTSMENELVLRARVIDHPLASLGSHHGRSPSRFRKAQQPLWLESERIGNTVNVAKSAATWTASAICSLLQPMRPEHF